MNPTKITVIKRRGSTDIVAIWYDIPGPFDDGDSFTMEFLCPPSKTQECIDSLFPGIPVTIISEPERTSKFSRGNS